ncbi:hypothetical protein C8R45DRAFT_948297 [Mycena sanguinolenta]|nr:hypothetical protein C8R45DRAFT_948297 [Mycena sanguinolenta]
MLDADTFYLSTTSFLDENTNYLQWNSSTSNTPAPFVPDTLFTFDFATVLHSPDRFSDASSDLGSFYESDSANWKSSWSSSGKNFWELENEFTSSASSFDNVLAVADSSLGRENVPVAADSLPVHLWGSEHLPVSSSSSSTVDLKQYEMSDAQAQKFLGWEWQKSCNQSLGPHQIFHVTGLPSQFRVPREVTTFPIDITHVPNLDPDTTVDVLLKDQDIHSWGDPLEVVRKLMPMSPGFLSAVLTRKHISPVAVPSPSVAELIPVNPLHPSSLMSNKCELDPNSRDRLVEAQLHTRETQDSNRTGQFKSTLVPAINIPSVTEEVNNAVTRPVRKRSDSASLQSDAPPKRLKLRPLKRSGMNMSATEYAEKHRREFQEEYPEILATILPHDIQVE